MGNLGTYADGRTFDLPEGWEPADPDVLDRALRQAYAASGVGELRPDHARDNLLAYFDPAGSYAGALFNTLGAEQTGPDEVSAADLLAVSTLNIGHKALTLRQLLEPGPKATAVALLLRTEVIPADLGIADLDRADRGVSSAAVLAALDELQAELRATPTPTSSRWVFAAKLLARKRPLLAPVRDNVVCKYLDDSPKLTKHGVGSFRTDIQVFAYLMSERRLVAVLGELWEELREKYGTQMDAVPLLRVLDVALWMAGLESGYGV